MLPTKAGRKPPLEWTGVYAYCCYARKGDHCCYCCLLVFSRFGTCARPPFKTGRRALFGSKEFAGSDEHHRAAPDSASAASLFRHSVASDAVSVVSPSAFLLLPQYPQLRIGRQHFAHRVLVLAPGGDAFCISAASSLGTYVAEVANPPKELYGHSFNLGMSHRQKPLSSASCNDYFRCFLKAGRASHYCCFGSLWPRFSL
jgi:hypothetical protein